MSQAGWGVASGRKARAHSVGDTNTRCPYSPNSLPHLVSLAAAAQRPREALQRLQQGRHAGGLGAWQGLQYLGRPPLQSMQLQMTCIAAVMGSQAVV